MKKILKITLSVALLGILSISYASEISKSNVISIDKQIENIKNSSNPKERFKLINRFKENIMKLNEQERMSAIQKLKDNIDSHSTQQVSNGMNSKMKMVDEEMNSKMKMVDEEMNSKMKMDNQMHNQMNNQMHNQMNNQMHNQMNNQSNFQH